MTYRGCRQRGDDATLEVQCLATNGSPTSPATTPTARVYALGSGVAASARLPVDPDVDSTGLFRGRMPLGGGFGEGRHAVVYLYEAGGLPRAEMATVEVSPGGDRAGPVIAAHRVSGSASVVALAQVGAGLILRGESPYIDEGVS